MTVLTYCRGRRVCPLCGEPISARRRDAVAHPGCGRELRRRRQQLQSDAQARQGAGRAVDGGTVAADVALRCPSCGARAFYCRLSGFAPVIGTARTAAPMHLGPRKMLKCSRCMWRGTVARAREAVTA